MKTPKDILRLASNVQFENLLSLVDEKLELSKNREFTNALEFTNADELGIRRKVTFVISGEYSNETKALFNDHVKKFGWVAGTILGSSENGERGGISLITLYFDV